MKGFGQQVQNQSYKSLYKQIELSVLGIRKTVDNAVTTPPAYLAWKASGRKR